MFTFKVGSSKGTCLGRRHHGTIPQPQVPGVHICTDPIWIQMYTCGRLVTLPGYFDLWNHFTELCCVALKSFLFLSFSPFQMSLLTNCGCLVMSCTILRDFSELELRQVLPCHRSRYRSNQSISYNGWLTNATDEGRLWVWNVRITVLTFTASCKQPKK